MEPHRHLANFDGDNVAAGGVTLNLVRTSDGYEDDGMGFTSVGGAMVEFDMLPDQSWSEALGIDLVWAHRAQGGKAIYDTGKELIGKRGKKWGEKGKKPRFTPLT